MSEPQIADETGSDVRKTDAVERRAFACFALVFNGIVLLFLFVFYLVLLGTPDVKGRFQFAAGLAWIALIASLGVGLLLIVNVTVSCKHRDWRTVGFGCTSIVFMAASIFIAIASFVRFID